MKVIRAVEPVKVLDTDWTTKSLLDKQDHTRDQERMLSLYKSLVYEYNVMISLDSISTRQGHESYLVINYT